MERVEGNTGKRNIKRAAGLSRTGTAVRPIACIMYRLEKRGTINTTNASK